MTKRYGIDLGTTYSTISWYDDSRQEVKPLPLESEDGETTSLRSVVYYPPEGTTVVGEVAWHGSKQGQGGVGVRFVFKTRAERREWQGIYTRMQRTRQRRMRSGTSAMPAANNTITRRSPTPQVSLCTMAIITRPTAAVPRGTPTGSMRPTSRSTTARFATARSARCT